MEIITTDYTMVDGTTIPLSLNYGLLFKLRAKDKGIYKAYNEALTSMKEEPEYGSAIVLYTAYACGHLKDHNDISDMMSMEDFFTSMSQDRAYNAQVAQEIYSPNQKKASAKRS